MFQYKNYIRAKSLEEAYDLYQKKSNVILGGMLWLKMQNRSVNTVIDLCDLGLDQIEEDDNEYRIGAYVSLRSLEISESLNAYTNGAIREALCHIVGVQFRNLATVGGSVWGRYGFSDVLTILMAMGGKVELFHAGIIGLDEFVKMPRQNRDLLVRIIIPKKVEKVSYLSQRNTQTDFPVLACAISKVSGQYRAVIGARPAPARVVFDEAGILGDTITEESAKKFASYVTEQMDFGSNMRAGKEYRRIICEVLVKRAALKLNSEQKGAC